MFNPARHHAVAGAIIGALLSGCVLPLPMMTDPYLGTRENLGDRVPGFIVPGSTRREDVLLALGEADEVAGDESWLVYRSSYRQGVVLFVYPSPLIPAWESTEYRKMTVLFDNTGVVQDTKYEKITCRKTEWMTQGGSGVSHRCVDAEGNEPAPGSLPWIWVR